MSTEKHTCCKKIWHDWRPRHSLCQNPAKMQHKGLWYCGVHDPVKRKEKRDANLAALKAKRAREAAQRKATAEALVRANGSCVWKCDVDFNQCSYDTGCGECYSFEFAPPEQCSYKFCPNCGKKIEFVKYEEPDAGE